MRILPALLLAVILLSAAASAEAAPGLVPPVNPEVSTWLTERLRDQARPLLEEGSRGLQRRRLAGEKAPSLLNAIVLTCDFADSLMLGRFGQVPGTFPPPAQTDRYYAAHDSVFFDHMMGKVADYYTAVSGGQLTINWTVHGRTINLPEPMAFYGNDPTEGEQSLLMAAQVVDSLGAEIDFTLYDTVILVHAGAGEETDILGNSPEQIFSTYLDPDDFAEAVEDGILDQPYLPAPGFAPGEGIDRVLVLPETEQQDPIGGFGGGFGSLGVYCFEVGLHLGMLSLSDFTPSGRPDSQGIGQYGLMGYGLFVGIGFIPPHPIAYNKLLMGWIDPYPASALPGGEYALTPSSDPTAPLATARVDISGSEFWLLEYRLQDPDGDQRWGFVDDKNGNGLPDFYDMDSANGDGTPTGFFDVAVDSVERVIGAEWDFAMSENTAREVGELGYGSGIYIWHVDEALVREVYDAPSNLFNADPEHKAVDLEEADGIQDLDSNEPSDYLLGSDDDAFRGESAPAFGPDTRPRTDTAAGVTTGISFTNFSDVVADSFLYPLGQVDDRTVYAFGYADTMRFTVATVAPGAGTPALHARRVLPAGTDLRGGHVLLGDLDGLGGTDEIILGAGAGQVWVLDGDLNEHIDPDGNTETVVPFAVGLRGGLPVTWNLPPALGDVDGDGDPEIVLTGAEGLFAFDGDGGPVRSFEAGAYGLYADLPGCELPPVLLPANPAAGPGASLEVTPAVVLVAGHDGVGAHLKIFGGPDGDELAHLWLGEGYVASPPVSVDNDFIVVAVADTAGGDHRLVVTSWTGLNLAAPAVLRVADMPGRLPLHFGIAPDSPRNDPDYYVAVVDTAGRGETLFFDGMPSRARGALAWPADRVVTAPLGLGGSFVAADVLGRVGHGGDWTRGWPRRPAPGGLLGESGVQGQPLVAEILGSGYRLGQFLFPTRDGRIFAAGAEGEWVAGWPLAGPAASAGTPALGQLGGAPDADLVAIGTFERVVGVDVDAGLAGQAVATVSVWRDMAAANPTWPMYGGSVWRNGEYGLDAWWGGGTAAVGEGIVPGSHICYPSPLRSGPLNVGGRLRAAARVRASIYNLEGELVTETGWRDVGGGDPFAVEVDLAGAVTGMYLCRLQAETPGAGTDNSVIQFAVVR